MAQILHDRYRIQSLLGRQTGRRTFLASDLQTGLSVVVKLLLFGPDFTWDDLKLFEREAEVLKALDHPAIPKYLDYFEVETKLGKGFALVQSHIAARSLQDWIQSGRTFSEEELQVIAKELLGILDYLHHRQPAVVHRDLKPSNILLGDRTGNHLGQVYLIDFGSVQTAVHGGTRTIVGTYGYMPPEQFGGQSIPPSDLYALGATLIYLATGQHPDQLPQREMRILFEDRVNLSPNSIDWLKWLTEPSTDLRLKSVKQALNALEKPTSRKGSLATLAKPVGSKVQVTNTQQTLEILIPPRGFHTDLMSLIGSIALRALVTVMIISSMRISTWDLGWFFTAAVIFHLYFCIAPIWRILVALFGTVRLQITQSEIFLTYEVLGLKNLLPLIASRQTIVKIELTRLSYERGSNGYKIAVPSQLDIWVGTKKFPLGNVDSLTAPELDWLAQILSNWLNLPIT
ncbi:serine/threonine protein kinase [Leptolyngbya sp. Cla-17]|uniref:serine/threonine protein kinase n=1 Tax=Leptolyngbya sp. Cla-17 TaxID=2803751 RepID=UPI0018D7CE75|nr:serine/threonine-protein kinase [Leptolyngbya sp. Cla-17]